MLRAYGDESMDEARQRVTAVAAVTGTEDDWAALEHKWVARNGGIPFHAADCDINPGRGDYAEKSHDENKALYRDLVTMTADSGLFGFGVAIDMAAQRKVFPDAIDFTYFRAFIQVLNYVKQHAEFKADIAEITFDARVESDHNAALLYADFREDAPGWKDHLASRISFETDTDNPRIQVADLMARETMKALDNSVGPVKRKPRLSWIALQETRRFGIFAYGEEWFQDFKPKLPAMNRFLGFTDFDYSVWLKERKRQHNQTNAFLFIQEKTKGKKFPELFDLPDE